MRRHFAFTAALAFLTACSSNDNLFTDDPGPGAGDGGSQILCIPGQQLECACPGGTVGAQACRDDGSGYLPCDCSAPAPADGGSDASSDGGGPAGDGGDGGNGDEQPDGGGSGSDAGDLPDGGGSGNDGGDLPADAGDEGGVICNEASQHARRSPLDIYVMLDRSGSMAWNIYGSTVGGGGNNPASRWYQVKEAIVAFVTDPLSAGIGVGLNYFSGDQCSVDAYRNPAVGFGLLPELAPAIESSLNANSPSGGTPTRPALQGALEFAKERADEHPDHTVVVVLATDGQPEGCSNNTVASVASVAADYADHHGIKTFVIGISTAPADLDAVAQAGGTGKAFMVTGEDVAQEFIDAMNDIRGASLPCEYEIPAPPNPGDELDYENIRLRFKAIGGATTEIDNVGAQANCGAGGFHYDDPVNPTKIVLCPETCQLVRTDDEAVMDILFACK